MTTKIQLLAEGRLEAWDGMTRGSSPPASTDEIEIAMWVARVAPLIEQLRSVVDSPVYRFQSAFDAANALLAATAEAP